MLSSAFVLFAFLFNQNNKKLDLTNHPQMANSPNPSSPSSLANQSNDIGMLEQALCQSAQCAGDRSSRCSQTSRVLHFCDGTMIVDENENGITVIDSKEQKQTSAPLAASQVGLRHPKWKFLQMFQSPSLNGIVNAGATLGRKSLRVVDYVGEGVASMLGITDPKYATEINHLNDQEEKERKRKETQAKQMSGWSSQATDNQIVEQQI